jgi:signal transduction histidine kinase/ligand-binding sensor domain-containing protein
VEDGGGALWVGTDDGGLARLEEGRFHADTARGRLRDEDVNALHVDRSGALWVGTDGGLARSAGGDFRRFTTRDGLPHDWVNAVREDRDGALWVATSGGLCRLREGRFETLTSREGQPNDSVLTLYEDREGRLWFGSAGGGLNRLRDGRWSSFTTRDGLPDDAVTSLFEDRRGTLWVGTRRGLCRLVNGAFRAVGGGDAASRAPVRAIEEGRDGSLWIGTYGAGVLRLQGNRWTRYGREQGLSHEHAQAIHEDAHGTLWVGTDGGGLNRFEGERFVSVTGLASGLVGSFHEDPGGALWVGTGAGPCRLEGGRVACFGLREGLFNDIVYQILDDGIGSLWFSCNKGVYRVAKRDLDDLAAGRRGSVSPIVYGRADGMRGVECNGGVQPAGWRARDGGIWFPTIKGAVRFDARRIVTSIGAPPLVIEQALVDRREVDPGRTREFPPGRGDLEIHYAALDLGDAHRVAYRYRLEGFDDGWIEAGAGWRTTRTSRRGGTGSRWPPPGRTGPGVGRRDPSRSPCGRASGRRRRSTLSARRAPCSRPGGSTACGWRRLKARQGEMEALVQERTRSLVGATRHLEEAQQRQADFVSGVSHALKTPLTLIRLYGETLHHGEGFSEDDRRSYYEIITRESERLTRLIERVLDFSWVDRGEKRYRLEPGGLASAVRQPLDIVGPYLKPQGFEVEVAIEPRLPPARFDPDAVVDAVLNLVDNAAKYSEEAKYVGIRLRADGNRIVCEVEDRGPGIPPAEREHLFRKFHRGRDAAGKGGYGLGLFLVKHIMDGHGGAIEVESDVGHGSRFRLIFPAAGAAPPAPLSPGAAVSPPAA